MSESPAVTARGSVGVMLPLDLPVGEVVPYVRRAEELGFDQVWVVEDLGWRGGVAQAATVLASTTHLTWASASCPPGPATWPLPRWNWPPWPSCTPAG